MHCCTQFAGSEMKDAVSDEAINVVRMGDTRDVCGRRTGLIRRCCSEVQVSGQEPLY